MRRFLQRVVVIVGTFGVGYFIVQTERFSRPRTPASPLSSSDLVYVRDDANRQCFAHVRGFPCSLVVVDCKEINWP